MLHTTMGYLRLLMPFIYLVGVWKLGDWKNRRNYYPTILFYLSVSFGISYLTSNYPLWRYQPTPFIPNHKIADFLLTLTTYISVVFLYLSHYPYKSSKKRQVFYLFGCLLFLSIIEGVFRLGRLMEYYHGWNYPWSIVVWLFTLIGVRVHLSKPIWAWLLCIVCTMFLILFFHIPVTKSTNF